ncbi:hypothetical protein [Treponema endosymbiont of Eucomonympha sp.]|nr:hypothetical protein [Treponema endosymbiont of Eucomonympha sp.]
MQTARVGAYEHSPRGGQAGRAANVRSARAGKNDTEPAGKQSATNYTIDE